MSYKGTLDCGFEFEIDEAIADDIEFLELLAEADENVLKLPALLSMLLGEDGKKALYEALKAEDGRTHTSDVMDAALEIVEKIPPGTTGKN